MINVSTPAAVTITTSKALISIFSTAIITSKFTKTNNYNSTKVARKHLIPLQILIIHF